MYICMYTYTYIPQKHIDTCVHTTVCTCMCIYTYYMYVYLHVCTCVSVAAIGAFIYLASFATCSSISITDSCLPAFRRTPTEASSSAQTWIRGSARDAAWMCLQSKKSSKSCTNHKKLQPPHPCAAQTEIAVSAGEDHRSLVLPWRLS